MLRPALSQISCCVALCCLNACDDNAAPTTRADAVTAKPEDATASPVSTSSSSLPQTPSQVTASPTATQTAPSPSDSASATAPSATASSASAGAEPTLTQLGRSAKITVRRYSPTGGVEAEAEISDAKLVEALLAAIDLSQVASDACPRCIASMQLVFHDAFKTRLGSLGLFCDHKDTLATATLRDGLANNCQSLTLKDVAALKKIVDDAFAVAPTQ